MTQARPIRLLVTDVDGTLVRDDKSLSPAVHEAACRLRDAGIRLAVVSSRATVGLDGLAEALALDTPRAGFNGAVVLEPDGRVLQELFIPTEICHSVVETFERDGLDPWLFADGRWLLGNPAQPYIEHECRSLGVGFETVRDFKPFLARTHKLMGVSGDFERVARTEAALAAQHHGTAAIHRSQLFHVDVTNGQANKGAAALLIARSLGVDAAEMACIGDMSNDIPMLQVAGLAIAMANAPDAVRRHAHQIVRSNEEDGWAEAVDRLILQPAERRAP